MNMSTMNVLNAVEIRLFMERQETIIVVHIVWQLEKQILNNSEER